MNNDNGGLPHIEVYRASKHLKYQHAKPEGAVLVLYCIFSVLLLLFIQNGFFSTGGFRLNGQGPNLVLVFVFLAGVKCRPRRALLLGLFSGLALDIFFGRYIGLYAILFMYIAFGACQLSDKLLNTKLKIILWGIPFFIVFKVVESLIIRILSVTLGSGTTLYTNYLSHFIEYILPSFFLNEVSLAIMIVPVYMLWRRLSPH